MAGIMGWGRSKVEVGAHLPSPSSEPAVPPLENHPTLDLQPMLVGLFRAQASVLEFTIRDQGTKIEQAGTLMSEAVHGFADALKGLDTLARDQYQLAMELMRVLEVSLEGQDGVQSVEDFTTRIVGTLDLFVQAMLEIGQSSFQLVEEMDGIRARSASMAEALGELAEVAMRTHMLALNASIEAAHARQYGAGFAVVAGEVQKLAVRSGRISDQISRQVLETEAALNRTTAQVEIIASKDLNEIIRSKQLAETMVKALSQSELRAQNLVARMEELGRRVTAQVGRAIQALQFEDMVRQILQGVVASNQGLAEFAQSIHTLADDISQNRRPTGDLLAQATRDFEALDQKVHDMVQSTSMTSGDVELF